MKRRETKTDAHAQQHKCEKCQYKQSNYLPSFYKHNQNRSAEEMKRKEYIFVLLTRTDIIFRFTLEISFVTFYQ